MQKYKANLFMEKFSLLNSQKHTEDIKWSSSSSSDYENTSCQDKFSNLNKTRNRKRKRKPKVSKNISNLDITFVDSSKDHKKHLCKENSPILKTKCLECPTSPILTTSKLPNKAKSPILLSNRQLYPKSPILMLKSESPKHSIKVRKQLFNCDQLKVCKQNSFIQNTERILCLNVNPPDTGNNYKTQVKKNVSEFYLKTEIESNDGSLEILSGNEISEVDSKEKLNLINKVKNYFDSHFSSENTSQNISDTPTPEDCIKNEEIQILSCRTQTVSFIQQLKCDSTRNSDCSNYVEKNTKKVKYKKGGLAYRLNTLLKKQNAHVSLWQHERFLADNSNFIIPKSEHVVFCIGKFDFKFGCYMLDVYDVKNEKYLILINSLYINNNVITVDSVLKLYEPYTVLDTKADYKIIVNVTKFECIDLKNISDNST